MNNKEKLDLLWKYLALLVVAVVGFRYTENISSRTLTSDKNVVFFADDMPLADGQNMNVEVKKEIVNGDTIMNVIVNGEEVDSQDFKETNDMVSWKSNDGKMHVFKMKKKGSMEDIDIQLDDDRKKVVKKRVRKIAKD